MTTTTNFLTEKDEELILQYDTIKNNIKSEIGIEKIVEIISNLIDKSKTFNFKNKKSRNLINNRIPLFLLSVNENELKKYIKATKTKQQIVNDAFHIEVIAEYSDTITKYIKDEENILKRFDLSEQEKIKQIESLRILSFLSATIFNCFLDEDNNFFVELVI